MRYLVTGAGSFIGTALVQRLRRDGHQADPLECDVRNSARVIQEAKGCDSIIHLAYAKPWDTDQNILDVAVGGMHSVLCACEQQDIRELMLVSSPLAADARRGKGNTYGAGKMICEMMASAWSESGILDRMIVARPFNVYGPGGGYYHVIPDFITRMRDLVRSDVPDPMPFPVRGPGDDQRSFIYIDDCIDQLCVLLSDLSPPGFSYRDVGTLDARTIASVAHQVARCYGREIRIVPSPLPPGAVFRRIPFDVILPPKITFQDGLARTVAWYREQEAARV